MSRHLPFRLLLAGSLAAATGAVPALAAAPVAAPPASAPGSWQAAWERPQTPSTLSAFEVALDGRGPRALVQQTVRAVLRVTADGDAVRVHLANRYGATTTPDGTTELQVAAATISYRVDGAAVAAESLRTLTFGGLRSVSVAPGRTVVSDPLAFPVRAGQDLAVSMHVPAAAVPPAHANSSVTSYVSRPGSGDRTAEAGGASFTERTLSTPILDAVDVLSRPAAGTVAFTGGSVVDGTGSTVDGHDDFPSQVSRRIRTELPAAQRKAVVNHGIGGTSAARGICSSPAFGPSVDARLADDTLDTAGLTHVVLFAGTNDIGFGCSGEEIIDAYTSIAEQAHRRGVGVLVATVTPRRSFTSVQNAHRERVNAWIRAGGNCSGRCEAIVDADVILRDPANPNALDPEIDSGDGIHPNGEGYGRLAAGVPLSALGDTPASPSGGRT